MKGGTSNQIIEPIAGSVSLHFRDDGRTPSQNGAKTAMWAILRNPHYPKHYIQAVQT